MDAADVKKQIQLAFEKFVFEECVPTLKSCTPVGKTGALRGTIHAEKISDKEYWIGTRLYYGKFVESGRGPVSPKVKKALYWPDLMHPVGRAGSAPAQNVVEKAIGLLGG